MVPTSTAGASRWGAPLAPGGGVHWDVYSLTTRCQPTPAANAVARLSLCPRGLGVDGRLNGPIKPAPGVGRDHFQEPVTDEGRGRRRGPSANFRRRDAAAHGLGPRTRRHCASRSSLPLAAAVPDQRGYAPSHPTPQSRHPAADGRRTHAPEVTQHSK